MSNISLKLNGAFWLFPNRYDSVRNVDAAPEEWRA